MDQNDTSTKYDDFLFQRNSLLIRGLVLAVTGLILTILTLVEPNVRIMSQNSSWLPMVTFVILIAGLFASLDSYIWRHSNEFFINLQIAVLDVTVGMILLNELNKSADKLILLVAAYLIIKGVFRIVAANAVRFSNSGIATLGGGLSVVMGILLWQQWFSSTMWFICFCLSVDIMTRGWALIRFGLWLKAQHKINIQNTSAN
ncbi:MAG: hypothetical protein PHR94_04840 [Methylomonas lenta]|nr:hypothetical protein [Methylomonas lenta]